MTTGERKAAMALTLAARWLDGQCHYCLITQEHVDGDRVRWTNRRRNVCSRSQCVRRFWEEVARELARVAQARRKRTPAEIHALKLEEARRKRAQYRQRRKGRVA